VPPGCGSLILETIKPKLEMQQQDPARGSVHFLVQRISEFQDIPANSPIKKRAPGITDLDSRGTAMFVLAERAIKGVEERCHRAGSGRSGSVGGPGAERD
jgi:hypothetical protein